MWRRLAAFSPPLPLAPTDSNNGKPPPGSSAIRRADAADMRRISGKRGKPGGDSAGEKSPLLPDARPPSAGRVADESAAQGSLFAGRHAVRPFLCRALSAVGQDRHERAFGRVSSFGHPPRAAAAARDASGIRFPGGGTASRCGRMFTGAREYPAFCSPGQLRRAFRRRLAASFSPPVPPSFRRIVTVPHERTTNAPNVPSLPMRMPYAREGTTTKRTARSVSRGAPY